MIRLLQRALAASVSAAIIIVSPGFEPYALAGNTTKANVGHAAPVSLPSAGLKLNSTLSNGMNLGVDLPAITLPGVVNVGIDASAQNPTAQKTGAAVTLPSAVIAQPSATNAQAARLVKTAVNANVQNNGALSPVQAANEALSQVAPASEISNIAPSAAYGAGRDLHTILTGELFGDKRDNSAPTANMNNSFGGEGFFFAKPAGDSIREANEANVDIQSGGGSNIPTPPQNGGGDGRRFNGGNNGPRIPFVAKVISAAVALAPIALIAAPLFAAGSAILGSLVVAASLGYAAFPFMSANTSSLIRSIPGVAVGLLGLAGVVTGVMTGGLGFAAIGALAAFGGWGLMRFAVNTQKWESLDETEVLLTMLGMLGAVAAVGLAAGPVVGIAAILKIASIFATLPLLMHLPGWIGKTITNSVTALYYSARQTYRVASSIRRDTSNYERIKNYSEAALEKSSWNVLWLGLIVWLPILVSETIQFVLGVAVGLVSGAVQIPQIALWTITHHFAKDSALNKRLAFGARAAVRLTSKQDSFNKWERPFIAWANDASFTKRMLAVAGIRAAQLVWLLKTPFVALGAGLFGWAFAGQEASKPYESSLHNPENLEAPRDTAGDDVPRVEKPTSVPGALPARILASAIGAAAFVALVLPSVFGGGLLGGLMALTGVSIALMPLIPAKNIPAWLAKAPGDFLMMAGVFTTIGAARYLLIGLPIWPVLTIGVVAALAGFGLRNLVVKLRNDEKQIFDTDDWQYSLGYVGALGTVAALAVAMTGAAGLLGSIIFWGGMVSSLTLLAHLPKYLWQGLGETFEGLFSSIAQSFRAFGTWHRKTDFVRNYMRGMGKIIKKYSVFVSPILLPFFLPVVAAFLLEWAASLVVGAALGVYHAPGLFAWSASYHKNPKSKMTRFWAGFNTVFYEQLEGTRKTFLEPFVEKYNTRDGDRLNWGGLFMAGLGTLIWLVRTALALALTPALIVWGVIKGIQRASKPVSDEDGYENRPDRVFSR